MELVSDAPETLTLQRDIQPKQEIDTRNDMSKNVKTISCIRNFTFIFFFLFGLHTSAISAEETTGKGLPYRTVADYIHDIIEADRTLYTTHVVDRMQETGTAIATESWEERNALPLPAQMLLLSGERVRSKGGGLNYRRGSWWPIYKKNGNVE